MIDIERISWIAKIKLSEEEKQELKEDIKKILEMFKKIQEIEMEESEIENISSSTTSFREESFTEEFNFEEILKNFPKKEDKLLEVPKLL